MAENVLSFLKQVGLTPASLLAGVALIGAWWQTLAPIPGEMQKINHNIQILSTKVEIHSVLISQLTELKQEVAMLRRDVLANAKITNPQ
jgi:hypothetical protein